MKRIITLVLTLALALTLCACSGDSQKVDLSQVSSISAIANSGAKIGAQSNTFHLEALKAQISGITVSDLDDFALLLTALKSGAIDGYVAEEPTAWSVCAKDSTLTYLELKNNSTGFTADDADVGIAVGFKKGSELTAKVNAIIAAIPQETRSQLMQQIVKLTENPDDSLNETLALQSTNTSTSNGTLKIAMECNYQPYNWTQTTAANGAVKIANASGYANGYDVQVAAYIAAELGMSLEVYAYEWDSLIPAVQSGNVDGIIAGMSPTTERKEQIDFSDCYWTSNLVIIIKKAA